MKLHDGGTSDLITVEQFNGQYQINAFEFTISDIKKVILRAEANLKYVHKSWVVLPIEKKDLIETRYKQEIENHKYIGVIGVDKDGKYTIIHQPLFQVNINLHQELLKLCIEGYQKNG